MRKIVLRLSPHPNIPSGIWEAYHFLDNEPEPYIVDLFDTHIIPTAFTGAMSGDAVWQAITALNPDYEVELAA